MIILIGTTTSVCETGFGAIGNVVTAWTTLRNDERVVVIDLGRHHAHRNAPFGQAIAFYADVVSYIIGLTYHNLVYITIVPLHNEAEQKRGSQGFACAVRTLVPRWHT
jgi:hypothetical protein